MSRGIVGIPASPRARRSSRPLSMICENPDDPSIDPCLNADINAKIAGQCDTVNYSPRPSQRTQNAIPTRRKAVAPLQHPVMTLLDNSTDSKNSNQKPSLPDKASTRQKKILIPQTTSTVSSIIKRFSSLNNTSNADSNDIRNRSSPKHPGTHGPNELEPHTKTSFDGNSEVLSIVLHSPEIFDSNHNSLSCKSANSYDSNSNSWTSRLDISSLNTPRKTSESAEDRSISESPSISSMNKCEVSASPKTVTENTVIMHDSSFNDSGHISCDESYNEQTPPQNSELENDKDDVISDRTNNDIHQTSSPIKDKILNKDDTPEVVNKAKDVHAKERLIPAWREHLFHGEDVNPENLAAINSEKEMIILNKPQDVESNNSNPFTCWSKSTNSRDNLLIHNEKDKSPRDCFPSQNQNNSKYRDKIQQFDLANSKPTRSHLPLDHSLSESELKLDTNSQELENSRTLDGETLEWKKRVKRSVSLIKIPNSPDLTRNKRRISSIHVSNLHSDLPYKNDSKLNPNFTKGGNKDKINITISNDVSEQSKNNNGVIISQTDSTEPVRRISAIDQSDFSLLKVTATRLNLPTRRPSVTAWKEKYLNRIGPFKVVVPSAKNKETRNPTVEKNTKSCDVDRCTNGAKDGLNITEDVKTRIDKDLAWLRQELIDIRLLDQSLARQFLNLRHAMNAFRLAVECEDHQELIEDAEEDMEEIRELSKLVDIPPEMLSHLRPLKHVGITRMNISSRRFSTC